MKMKLLIAAFLLVLLHRSGAVDCYYCIDDQCHTNPYETTCSGVCIAYQFKLQNPPQILTSKYCVGTTDSVLTDRNCQNADAAGFVLPTLGCYYCSTDFCNTQY